jgi:NAD(P)-dependent dehydrogenase (short-subunit alcohol dehydrogenase family)
MSVAGKTVLVTGAGRGFGWGIAVALAGAGAKVAVTDINEADVERTVKEIQDAGGNAFGYRLDVADEAAFGHVVRQTIERTGGIYGLIHSAIYMPLAPFEATPTGEWQRQVDVGLGGLFHGVKAVWEAMVAGGGGHIVGIASGSSVRGYHNEVPYCTVKHAQEGFVKALALEAREHQIAVNTVGPGKPIKTTRVTWEELETLPEEQKAAWADPRDLGQAFVWLLGQPTIRFSGLRFDAGPIVETLRNEGEAFVVSPDKVTLYPEDFKARQDWFNSYSV